MNISLGGANFCPSYEDISPSVEMSLGLNELFTPQHENRGDIENNYSLCQQDDVVDAAIMSNAHNFITAFPHGYDTDVGEGSVLISGGQKQRIAIARAIIKKPSILLLDEATSALDAISERMVQESIDAIQAMKKQTTLIIAHRLSTIVNADKIVVIENNRISDVGTHEELLVRSSHYSQLWSQQAANGSK
jgi:ABC-type multidrug transport system fused ATPase/permease subunit